MLLEGKGGTNIMCSSNCALFSDLVSETSDFFSRHWNKSVLGNNVPEWKLSESPFAHVDFPYHDKGGCYALCESDKIIYWSWQQPRVRQV